MDARAALGERVETQRPAGRLQPRNAFLTRVSTAVEQNRFIDAEKLLQSSEARSTQQEDASARTWHLLLSADIAFHQGRLSDAESLCLQACSLGLTHAAVAEGPPQVDSLRLAARALHELGRIHRRQEKLADAQREHETAFSLRRRIGSHDELWETACELGLDADVARRFDEAERWHRAAIAEAVACTIDVVPRQAKSWSNLAVSLAEGGRRSESVEAARIARDLWRQHDSTATAAALAEKAFGNALLLYGEELIDASDAGATGVLYDAIRVLTDAADELAAFGPVQAVDADACRQQVDLARRLLASASPLASGA